MTLLDAIVALIGGLAAVYCGVRMFLARVYVIDLEPEWETRRAARVERMDDFRQRRVVDERTSEPRDP